MNAIIFFIFWFSFYDLLFCDNKTELGIKSICFSHNCRTLCNSWRIDAVLDYKNGTVLAFKGNLFWQILNPSKPAIPSNANVITDYWNTNSNSNSNFNSNSNSNSNSKNVNLFKGPIDAAFYDQNGFTHFFKRNKVFIFKELSFTALQIVPRFDSINGALLVNQMRDNETNVYIFKGNNYWQIMPYRKMYDWLQISSIFQNRNVDTINADFPNNIDAAFQDIQNNIIIIKGPQYINISANHFPNSINSKDLIPKFVFKDLYYCEKYFYETTIFSTYDQFLIELISHNFKHSNSLNTKCLEKTCNQSSYNWYYIFMGVFIGIVITILLHCLRLCFNRESSISSINDLSYANPRVHDRKQSTEVIDLIRQNPISVEI